MRIELTDSASRRHVAELLMEDPRTHLADLFVPTQNDGLGFSTIRIPARSVPYDASGRPFSWRRIAA